MLQNRSSAGLRPDKEKLKMLLDPLAGFGERIPGQRKGTKERDEKKGRKGEGREGSIPALLFLTSSPGFTSTRALNLCGCKNS